jgi:hypothetical protein
VYVEDKAEETPLFFQTTLKLVGNYLARLREVAVTDDAQQANVSVVSSIHAIDKHMYQIWVTAKHRPSSKYLPGVETEAYVSIETPKQQMMTGISEARLDVSVPSFQDRRRPPAIISSFDLVAPVNQDICASDAPWQAGAHRLNPHAHLPTGGCLAVELRLAYPAAIFLVGQDATGNLNRIFPSDCPDFQALDSVTQRDVPFRFPPRMDSGSRVLQIEGTPGMERIYAIAIADPELAHRFHRQLDELQGLCRPGRSFPAKLSSSVNWRPDQRIDRWQDYLKYLASQSVAKMQWQEFRFWHDRPL